MLQQLARRNGVPDVSYGINSSVSAECEAGQPKPGPKKTQASHSPLIADSLETTTPIDTTHSPQQDLYRLLDMSLPKAQCTRKNLVCEGYSTRLQWMPCDQSFGDGAVTAGRTTSQRRLVSFNKPTILLDDATLDELLAKVDGEADWQASIHSQCGPFGVFPASGMEGQLENDSDSFTSTSSTVQIRAPTEYMKSMTLHPTGSPRNGATSDVSESLHINHLYDHSSVVATTVPESMPYCLDACQIIDSTAISSGQADGTEPMAWNQMATTWTDVGHMSQVDQLPAAIDSPGGLFRFLSQAISEMECETSGRGMESTDFVMGRVTEDWEPAGEGGVPVLPHGNNEDRTAVVLAPERPLAPSMRMQPNVRFLFQYYADRVIDTFCMTLSNTRSPWKAIHLPRALQGNSELEVMGATSHARRALLNALLSITAHIWSNQQEAQQQQPGGVAAWRKVGSQLRMQALSALRVGLANGLDGPAGSGPAPAMEWTDAFSSATAGIDGEVCMEEHKAGAGPNGSAERAALLKQPAQRTKYKELLAAMLSMITIDVASGDTATTRTHLLGCESLIRSARKWKRQYSAKARSLHRIFYYLRVIYETTNLDYPFPADEDTGARSGTHTWLEQTLCDGGTKGTSCEFIYAVPATLLILLARVAGHVRQLDRLGGRCPTRDATVSAEEAALAAMGDKLEAEVLTFPVDAIVAGSLDALSPEDRLLVEHQTRSFHQAVILYFCQNVRRTHALLLRPYVEAVLSHAMAIEEIKRQNGASTGTMFWPCFIAASEAVDTELQHRFQRWHGITKSSGFAACQRGHDVVREVWRRGQAGWPREQCSWRAVARAWNVCLVMS